MKHPVAGLCPRVGPKWHAQPRGEARGKVEATKEHDLGRRGTMGKRAGVGRARNNFLPVIDHVTRAQQHAANTIQKPSVAVKSDGAIALANSIGLSFRRRSIHH